MVLEIKNNTRLDYYLKQDELALDGLDCDCFLVKKGKKEMKYDGYLVKRGRISEERFLLLKAGEKLMVSVDLGMNYRMEGAGFYTVGFKRVIHFVKDLDAIQFSEIRKEEGNYKQRGFFLLGRKRMNAPLTIGESERIKSHLNQISWSTAEKEYPDPQIECDGIGISKNEFEKTTKKAHTVLMYYLQFVKRELLMKEELRQENLHYEMAFGNYGAKRYEKVAEVFEKVIQTVKNERLTYTWKNEKGIFGYTSYGSRQICLCREYRKAALTGEDSKMGTILHELTHAAANTDDVIYGRDECRELAKTDAENAIKNADSFEFFFETRFLNRFAENKWDGVDNAAKLQRGGPVVQAFGGNQIFLFYADEAGTLWQAIYDKTTNTFSPPQQATTVANTPILAAGHPEVIVFHADMYLFFLEKESKNLMLCIYIEGKWTVPIPVTVEADDMIKPAYTPQPVIYGNKINFIYLEDDGEGFCWIAGDKESWVQKEQLPVLVEKYVYHPSPCVYEDTLYLFFQIQYNQGVPESENRKIHYMFYREDMEVWSQSHDLDYEIAGCKGEGQHAKIPTDARSAIRAVNGMDVTYLIYRGKNSSETVQVQMGKAINGREIIWTDFEGVRRSSTEGLELIQALFCSATNDANCLYTVYQRPEGNEVYMSKQLRV